jgi:hypothetical protein
MEANHIDDGGAQLTETERVAAQLLLRLDALSIDAPARARDAERYATRLRFALDHVADLRRSAAVARGVFAPARVEVAISILESHAITAARFLGVTRRGGNRTSIETVADATDALDGETRAA